MLYMADWIKIYKDQLPSSAQQDKDWLVSVWWQIHQNQELRFQDLNTDSLIRQQLNQLGIPYSYSFAKTCKPVIALHADMDALLIKELVEWEHKSKIDGQMHACGHDAYTTMLLGAAKLLNQLKNSLEGTVRLLFQPAEEGGAGAAQMIREGDLGDAEAIFGMHIDCKTPTGGIALVPSPICSIYYQVFS